ncbi:MAG: endopeptidase La [Anaerolineales bacterium]|uniref:Lon protease n=1 Tax=Candidatus Desulfolinea nitratireducens TaxID=2841698 RepID=A0A8J6NJP9_9CHLR|nr:endopeptidase La [Candidatus Desulfolinea nitratireducens]MBL6961150.1 endopeptidase La [Anaerolineales bacterium]
MELLIPSVFSELKKITEDGTSPDETIDIDDVKTPEILPILPLRGVVVYPQTAVPLTIGQSRSIKLVDDILAGNKLVGLVASRNPEMEEPGAEDLYEVGTVANVHRLLRAPDGTIRLLVQGIERFRLGEVLENEPYLKAKIILAPEIEENNLKVDALARNARDQFSQIAEMIPSFPDELMSSISSLLDPLETAYTIANFQRMELHDAQELLAIDSTEAKLHKLVSLLSRENQVLQLGQKIQNEARGEIEKVQRDYFLREQLKAIQKELGERDEQAIEVEEFHQKIEAAKMSPEAEKQAYYELDRLSRLPTAAAEYGVIRTYLDWLVTLPWSKATDDNLEIAHARKILNNDHYGLDDVKERILEFLAIRGLRIKREGSFTKSKDLIRREREGVILCFVGPPGVGKTSLGRSIAHSMGREFIRISLGGVRDEAEIRGHRRTYIGALPGRILQALRRAETKNPVFMLDEIDKLVANFQGNPASALLEVLDPEQNSEFRDHYLEVAFDLSQVMFITTANSLGTIPRPLLDRMEVIHLSGYTEREKVAIAKGYLIPRQIRENSLFRKEVSFTVASLNKIINQYTREAGVRNLERMIGSICRKVGGLIAEGIDYSPKITPEAVEEYLDHPIYRDAEDLKKRISIPGVAAGLAWTAYGGNVLFIEATSMSGSKGFQITGSLGNVMQESARAALSYVRSRAEELGIKPDFYDNTDIHLHVPAGAQRKDGPSAGVTMITALVSLVTRRKVRKGVGMTGEITLRGRVLPIGGLKEKILAAHRFGLRTIIYPKGNETDLDDIPDEVRKVIKFIPVETVDEVLDAALEKRAVAKKTKKIAGIK